MTQEEKHLLLKDLCARLPYGVKLDNGLNLRSIDALTEVVSCSGSDRSVDYVRPYLRPMSSMAEEEKEIYSSFAVAYGNSRTIMIPSPIAMDYLLSHNFDVRGLIPRGLALEAPTDMYKTE